MPIKDHRNLKHYHLKKHKKVRIHVLARLLLLYSLNFVFMNISLMSDDFSISTGLLMINFP